MPAHLRSTVSRPLLIAIIFVANYVMITGTAAQNVYKCGESYTQTPCPGGTTINANDGRTGAQKSMADAATAKDKQVADSLEKDRLMAQKQNLTAAQGAMTKGPALAASAPATKVEKVKKVRAKPRQSGPREFTAQVPGEKALKPTHQTNKAKQAKKPKDKSKPDVPPKV